MAVQQIRPPTTGMARWWAALAFALALFIAACASSTSVSKIAKTPVVVTPSPTNSSSSTGATIPPGITPIAGTYSLYVDPTFGYSFEYPTSWIVYPAQGNDESNVAITEPYIADPNHPYTLIMVRATKNWGHQFVQQIICGQTSSAFTVDGYNAVSLDTRDGSVAIGLSGTIFGRGLFAKGLAFEIILEGSPRESQYIDAFMRIERPTFQHLLDTFNPGPGATTIGTC